MADDPLALAEVAVEPGALGDAHTEAVETAMRALAGDQVEVFPGAASSVVHGPLSAVCAAIQRAQTSVEPMAERVVTTARIETRGADGDFSDRLERLPTA